MEPYLSYCSLRSLLEKLHLFLFLVIVPANEVPANEPSLPKSFTATGISHLVLSGEFGGLDEHLESWFLGYWEYRWYRR